MSKEQVPIRFPGKPSYAREDFVLGECNSVAVDWIERWHDWRGQIKGVCISGERASGKSHLGAIWQEMSGAFLFDCLNEKSLEQLEKTPHVILDHPKPEDPCWQEDIFFHLLNRISEKKGSVLILSRFPIAGAGWSLPDLQSRLSAMPLAEITTPEDEVRIAVMQKIADDIGLALSLEACQYIASRTKRSFATLSEIIDTIDKTTLMRKKKVSIALLGEIIDEMEPRLI